MIKQQTSKEQTWFDEAGASIPYNRTTPAERLREKKAAQLAKAATSLSKSLAEFKTTVMKVCAEVVDAIRAENKIKTDSKGNITWYNFDQTIKIEVNVNDLITFDDVLIDGAKQLLMELIDTNISGDSFIKSIVVEAFQTSTGKLDTKRILGLKKHTSRITNATIKAKWNDAMELIDKSISRPESRSYYRIWIKDANGVYQNIDLNFSSIKAFHG